MLKPLVKVRMAALLHWFSGGSRTRKAQSKGKLIAFSALMLYAFFYIGMMVNTYFSQMSPAFSAQGVDWLYYALALLSDFVLMFIMCVFMSRSQLYEAKDNELLLSMPVTPGAILLSRTIMLLVTNIIFSLPVVIPVAINAPRAIDPVAFCIVFALMPFLTLAVSCFFGWLISLATVRTKRKSAVSTLLTFALLGAYPYFSFSLTSKMAEIGDLALGLADKLSRIPYMQALCLSIAGEGISGAVVFAVFTAAVMIATYVILSRTFIRLTTTKTAGAREKYVEKEHALVSADKALLRREFARIGSSSAYMVNAGLGIVVCIGGAVALLIKGGSLGELLAGAEGVKVLLGGIAVLLPTFVATMHLFSAASVSLDGKNIWIVHEMPVTSAQVLQSKINASLILTVPAELILAAACAFVFKPANDLLPLTFLMPLAMTYLMTLLGLAENLRHPNMDWINETQAVKSGVGVLFTLLLGWALMAPPVVLLLVFGQASWFAWGFIGYTVALMLGSRLLYRWLMTRGAKLYSEL